MKKFILVLIIAIAIFGLVWLYKNRICPLSRTLISKEKTVPSNIELKPCQENLLKYLKSRKDNLALGEADKILATDPNNTCAWWARAEILRRSHKYKESESLLKQILIKYPQHPPSLISLAYIRYYDNKFAEALKILKGLLKQPDLDKENEALIFMLIGSVNAKRSSLGGIISKVAYGTRIKGYFEKAKAIAPDLAEVHLGLGSFYLLAPKIAGGNINKAIEELEYAVKLAPDFATPNARLAQVYKKKGNLEKYNFYLKRAKELDPENEALREIK